MRHTVIIPRDDHKPRIHIGVSRLNARPLTHKLVALRGKRYSLDSLDLSDRPPEHLMIDKRILYDLPSAGGASGAPVFDDDWHVIGQHIGRVKFRTNEDHELRNIGFSSNLNEISQFLQGFGVEAENQQLLDAAVREINEANRGPGWGD